MNFVEEILKKAIDIHLKKRADYTTHPEDNPFENFERANEIISWFPPEYKSFAGHIGTKLARLGSLLSTGKVPNNESTDDSFLDLVTYCALMYGFYKVTQAKKPIEPSPRTPKQIAPGVIEPLKSCIHQALYENGKCISCNTDLPSIAIDRQYRWNGKISQFILR